MAVSDALRVYQPGRYPEIDSDLRKYLTEQHNGIREAFATFRKVVNALDTTKTPLVSAANDTAAAAAGVPLNGLYHTSGAVKMRLT